MPSSVIKYGGYLSAPNTDVGGFLRSRARMLGLGPRDLANLVTVQEYSTAHNGARHVLLRQLDGGREVHGSLLKVTLDRLGRVVYVAGDYFPGAAAEGPPELDAGAAVLAAARTIGARPTRPLVPIARDRGAAGRTTFTNTIATRLAAPSPISAELVTFPMPRRRPARLAWRTLIETDRGAFEVVVDARSGAPLSRNSFGSRGGPEGNVFTVQHPDLGSQQIVSFAGAAFDNAGWVTDRTTAGNNANAYEDLNNNDGIGYQPQTPPSGDPAYQHFAYAFTDALVTSGGTNITTDRDATVTQAFYWVNFLHDYFYGLGFDEPAGNFQDDNFGRGGVGGDAMLIEVHNGAVSNFEGSNTQTPPGGTPRMELAVYGTADGAMDADHIAHEYTHGVTNRLLVGETPGGGIPQGIQSWALGEGWSDFFGTSIFDDPVAGEYVCGNPATGCPLYAYDASPLVYSDLCTLASGCEPHRDGEIWTAALWDMRRALIVKYGAGPGKSQAEQLVIDGLKNTPSSPDYLEARDGILAADMTNNGGANQCLIWGAFAGREMGFSASTTGINDQNPNVATDGPASCTPVADADGPYSTMEGTNATLDASASTENGDGPFTYAWDLDNDSQYDDATGPSPAFTDVGQDGVFPVGLEVTNGDGFSATDSTLVTVTNAAPTVINVASNSPRTEGGTVTITGTVTDPGWEDSLAVVIQSSGGGTPGTITPVAEEHVRPDGTLDFSVPVDFGDNGTYTVRLCGHDDDVTTDILTNCADVGVTFDNVDPIADILVTMTINGQDVILGSTTGPTDLTGRSSDPGSDDLTFDWAFGDGDTATATSLVNPPVLDPPFPPGSPSIQPRVNVDDMQSHTYGDACLYTLDLEVTDDDGGSNADQASVIISANAGEAERYGYWKHQYKERAKGKEPHPDKDLTAAELLCYLEITKFGSAIFDEVRGPLNTLADGAAIFENDDLLSSHQEKVDKQLFSAWLNFANGAFGFDQLIVDTDGDHVADASLAGAVAFAEPIRANPASTKDQLEDAWKLLEKVNKYEP